MLHVLIADDEKVICDGLTNLIDWEACGCFLPQAAYNGYSALRMLELSRYDVLITDIRMPEMSGLQLANEVRRRYPYCKVLIMSGYSDFEYARTAIDCGVLRYLLKPVDENELTDSLRDIAEKASDALSIPIFPLDKTFYCQKGPAPLSSDRLLSMNFDQLSEFVLQGNEQAAFWEIDHFIEQLIKCHSPASTRFSLSSALVLRMLQLISDTGQPITDVLGAEFEVAAYVNAATVEELTDRLKTLCKQVMLFIFDRKTGKNNQEIKKIMMYIEKHCFESLTIIKLGKTFYMNPVYLGRKFKESTGTSVRQYLSDCRLERAKKKLLTSEEPVATIALNTGFSDLDTFYTQFKKSAGMTPTQYRTLFSE